MKYSILAKLFKKILILLNFNKKRREITTLIDEFILQDKKVKELEKLFEEHFKF